MRLVRIIHLRCEVYSEADTFIWVPDAVSDETIGLAVFKATEEHLELSRKESEDYYIPYGPSFKDNPDMLVKDVIAQYEKLVEEVNRKREEAAKANLPFGKRVCSYIEGAMTFWDYVNSDDVIEVYADWGHNHGITIDYDNTAVDNEYEDEWE